MANGSRGVKGVLWLVMAAVLTISLALAGLSPSALAETVEDSSEMEEPAVVEADESDSAAAKEGGTEPDTDEGRIGSAADGEVMGHVKGGVVQGSPDGVNLEGTADKDQATDKSNGILVAQSDGGEGANNSSGQNAEPDGENLIASGEWGTCYWSIDSDGLLRIWPMQGEEGKLGESATAEDVPWHQNREAIRRVTIERGVCAEGRLGYLFQSCENLSEADVSKLDTSLVTDMRYVFSGCSSLASLDVSGWETSSVKRAPYMFSDCSSLTSLNITGWDTSSMTDMVAMFYGCSSLTSIDASGWDTSSVTSMSDLFFECSSLTSIDTSGWDTSSVTEMGAMFYGCSSLASIDVSGWDTPLVTSMTYMFYGCSSLASLDVFNWDTSSVKNTESMFHGCSLLATLNISGWDTSSMSRISSMFAGCSSLKALDLSSWDVSSVTSLYQLFSGCSSLEELNLSGWDTSSTTDMSYVFDGCSSLTALDVSDWDTSCATNMFAMFRDCSKLVSLNLSDWDTSCVKNMGLLFFGCSSLTSLDLSGWDTSSMPSMDYMFTNCSKLECIAVGDKYEANKAFPSTPDKWWSASEEAWFTVSEIQSSRSGIADTYWTTGQGLSLSRAEAKLGENAYVYQGSQICPPVIVTSASATLKEGVDYSVEYGENTNVGKGTVRLVGTGAYRGSIDMEFEIEHKAATVTANDLTKAVGEEEPVLTASVSGLLGDDEVSYTVSREPGEKAGSYTITPSGEEFQGNYRVSYVPGTLVIVPTLADAQVAPVDDQQYCGKAIEPSLSVELEGKSLERGVDYEVSFSDNVKAGTAKATLRGIGAYSGTVEVTFSIVPKSVTVMAPSLEKAYSEDDPELAATIEGILEGDSIDYSVSREPGEGVGTYAITPVGGELQGNYRVRFVRGTLTIAPRQVTVTAGSYRKVYGTADPALRATVNGLLGDDSVDYSVTREPGEDIGTYATIATGEELQGNYRVRYVPGTFVVEPKEMTLADAQVAPVDDQQYCGTAIEPSLSVELEGKSLERGVDYEVSFSDNVNVGVAKAALRGIGAYSGTVEVTFLIVPKSVTVRAPSVGKTYGDEDPDTALEVEGLLEGDSIDYSV